jgi:hypothetical protein
MKTMKKKQPPKQESSAPMRAEYQLDYAKAKPNRFAGRVKQEQLIVMLDPDVAEIFTTQEAVNHALRALIAAMPKAPKRRAAHKDAARGHP